MLSLSLNFEINEDESLCFNITLTNNGEASVNFQTASSQLFHIAVGKQDEPPLWTGNQLSTQAVEHWTLEANESLTRTAVWEYPPNVYTDIAERHDETLEDYCHQCNITNWKDYTGETLVAVIDSLGTDNPSEEFEFIVSEDLPQTYN